MRNILIFIASKIDKRGNDQGYPQLWYFTPPPKSRWRFLRTPLRKLCKLFIGHEPSNTEHEYDVSMKQSIRYCRWCNEKLRANIKEDPLPRELSDLIGGL